VSCIRPRLRRLRASLGNAPRGHFEIETFVHTSLRVMIVDERPERAQVLAQTLGAAGCEVIAQVFDRLALREQVARLRPDVIIIDMECPDRDALEDMSRITRDEPRPTVMFVDRSDSDSIRAAVQAGVSAYVVGGVSAERVRPILEVAIARFEEFQSLRRELEDARSSLAERKVIERAKGILMKHREMSEEDAFRSLRKMAMDRKMRLVAIAREVVAAAEILR
jgi:two-component system, response regulator / RNA-binding antiterminator